MSAIELQMTWDWTNPSHGATVTLTRWQEGSGLDTLGSDFIAPGEDASPDAIRKIEDDLLEEHGLSRSSVEFVTFE